MVSVDFAEEASPNEELRINEEYKVWKKNTPYLYDLMVAHGFEWPATSLQWLPDIQINDDRDYNLHRIVTGTNTSGQEQNYLTILTVQIPNEKAEIDAMKFCQDTGEAGGYGENSSRIAVHQTICHDGEVNRARYMPQNPNIIASKTVGGEVHVFDRTKHSLIPFTKEVSPDARLVGQDMEGYSVSWNKQREGTVLSGSKDRTACVWDIAHLAKAGSRSVEPVRTFSGHTGTVNDTEWDPEHENMFCTAGDDGLLLFWDTRQDVPATVCENAHGGRVNSIAFNFINENLLATAGGDKVAALWDPRKLAAPVHSLVKHSGEILQVEWSPNVETALATGGYDRRVCVWDIAQIGREQTDEEREDGPPELLFMHGGHTNTVIDLSWNLEEPWVIASTAEDNVLHVWEMEEGVYADDSS
ncbi:MAG: histone-binding protein RBBP4 [Amphiamblys sp. WSBS2006]|nr:MAG: histone-binding protein RBBP4 [Amphiamblys sp. WSBS2006]